MELYYPIFDKGWKIETVDSESLHSYNGYDVSGGTLMYSDRLFTSEDRVRHYINRQYGKRLNIFILRRMKMTLQEVLLNKYLILIYYIIFSLFIIWHKVK